MAKEKPRSTSATSREISDKLEQCIKTLENNARGLGAAELRLKAQLEQLHAESKRLFSSAPPFKK